MKARQYDHLGVAKATRGEMVLVACAVLAGTVAVYGAAIYLALVVR